MSQAVKQQVLDAFHFRVSTREYDPVRKVSREDINYILELGRLSPSSCGTEPWQFVVVTRTSLLEKLKPYCGGMSKGIMDASFVVFILAKKNLRFDTPYMRELFVKQRQVLGNDIDELIEMHRYFQQDMIDVADDQRALFDWAGKNTYIALANMLTGAAMIGIDSCPIEGMNYKDVNRIFTEEGLMDAAEWGISVGATFGYRAHEIKPRSRKAFDEVVKWVE